VSRIPALLISIALAASGLAACGDDNEEGETSTTESAADTSTTGPGSTVRLSAPSDGDYAYDQESLSTKAGTVTIDFTNPAALPHDVVLEDESGNEVGKTDLISGGEAAATTVELTPGTYTYFCDVPGHREGGMEGTLTVTN
jgi:plastocyanin